MPVSLTLHTTGLDRLRSTLSPSAIDRLVAAAAFRVEAEAKRRAPVDTGYLQGSLQTLKEGSAAYIVGVGAEYGIHQEFGTRHIKAQPFLTPAVEAVRPGFLAAVESAMREGNK